MGSDDADVVDLGNHPKTHPGPQGQVAARLADFQRSVSRQLAREVANALGERRGIVFGVEKQHVARRLGAFRTPASGNQQQAIDARIAPTVGKAGAGPHRMASNRDSHPVDLGRGAQKIHGRADIGHESFVVPDPAPHGIAVLTVAANVDGKHRITGFRQRARKGRHHHAVFGKSVHEHQRRRPLTGRRRLGKAKRRNLTRRRRRDVERGRYAAVEFQANMGHPPAIESRQPHQVKSSRKTKARIESRVHHFMATFQPVKTCAVKRKITRCYVALRVLRPP